MRILILVSILLCTVSSIQAQKKKEPAKESSSIQADSVYASLKWRNIGPFRGGRSNAVTGVPGNDQLYYVGYTGGGVWKTEDAGISWRNISDGSFSTSSIGDIAVAASDPNVIYVGTGEHAVRGVMTSYGDGMYKSTDAGKSWKKIGLEKTRHIADVIIHPQNADLVYVAAQGTVHGPNNDRGIYRSADGGVSWKKILYINDSTGISSLSMDLTNPRVLYAASWEHRRYPWTVVSGGPGSAIWKSTDGGDSWQKLSGGLPAEMGKVGVSVSKANPNRVFAIVETEKSKSGLYRSDDAGKTWSLFSNNQDICSRSWYYMEVLADPLNENIVYVMNAPLMRSIDGGRTFSNIRVGHGDTHDLWINPSSPSNLILGDDGGAEISFNTGRTWSTQMNQPTAQFYRVNVDNTFPYKVYGGQQDNSSVIIASRNNLGGISDKDWTFGAGCECAYLAFDPNNPELVYGGCYQGYIEVLNRKTGEAKDIQAYPTMNLAIEPKEMKYRFNWNAPILASPHDPKTIYHAANVLLKTTNGGISWEAVSPDLTRNEKSKQGPGGGPLTNEGAGGENYNTIYYVIESAQEKGVIWTGSDCGLLHLTTDGGKNWKNVTPAGLPESMINSIELSPHDKGTAYVSATRYKFNDYTSYTYKTTDYGKTWMKINEGIQADDFIRVIREDKKAKGLLYGGTERGFYISNNGGLNWHKMQLNLPVVPITDMIIRDNDLVASTAGRAFWILDDLGPIQQSSSSLSNAALKLFTPKPSYRYGGGGELQSLSLGRSLGQNAPEGVILDYNLPELSETDTLKMEILDAYGKVIRTYTSKKNPSFASYPGGPSPDPVLPVKKGINRFLWNFRGDGITPDIPGAYIWGDYRGNRIPPGEYKARISVKNQEAVTSISVLQDPNLQVNPEDWKIQQETLAHMNANISEMHKSVIDLRKVTKQLEHMESVLKDVSGSKDVMEAGKSLKKKITDWEAGIVETRIQNGQDVINWPSKLNAEYFNLRQLADAHDPRITQGMKQRLADLDAEWVKSKAELDGIKKSIEAYNALYKNGNFPAIRYE